MHNCLLEGRKWGGRKDDMESHEEAEGGGEGERRCTVRQVSEWEKKRGLSKGFRRFLTVRRCRVRTIYLRGVIFLLSLFPSPLPPWARTDGGGHNGLHTLSHRDDTTLSRKRIPGPLNAQQRQHKKNREEKRRIHNIWRSMQNRGLRYLRKDIALRLRS